MSAQDGYLSHSVPFHGVSLSGSLSHTRPPVHGNVRGNYGTRGGGWNFVPVSFGNRGQFLNLGRGVLALSLGPWPDGPGMNEVLLFCLCQEISASVWLRL